jgi:hypothetical protein
MCATAFIAGGIASTGNHRPPSSERAKSSMVVTPWTASALTHTPTTMPSTVSGRRPSQSRPSEASH